MAAISRMWLQEPRGGCISQDGAAGAKLLLQEQKLGCMSQDMAFRVQVWLLEQCFYIVALEGRA